MNCRICRLDLIVKIELSINSNIKSLQTSTVLDLLDMSQIFFIIEIPEKMRHSTHINKLKVAKKLPIVEINFSI